MNLLLKILRDFVKVYIKNIICCFKIFEKHLRHLRILFRIFQRKKITIKFGENVSRIFQRYTFRTTCKCSWINHNKKKLKVITVLKCSENLTILKRYLRLIKYLRKYIYFFAKVFKSLQEFKTKLFNNAFKNNAKRRKRFTNRFKIISTNKEITSFLLLQKNLTKAVLLTYFDKEKWFWIDLDEFKKFYFEVIIFHVIKKFSKEIWSIKNDIQLIMFLSKLLIFVEKNY
jgi:hypothetical protein